MKRSMVVLAASVLLVAGAAAPARAADEDCLTVGDECMAWDEITEDTELYVGNDGGSLVGFTAFGDFKKWASSTYGITFTEDGGSVDIDDDGGDTCSANDDNDCGDNGGKNNGKNDNNGKNNNGGTGRSMARIKAQAVVFYDKSTVSGRGFAAGPTEKYDSLDNVNGDDWDNRISSFRTDGGKAGKAAGLICVKRNCKNTGPIMTILNDDSFKLPKGFNNEVSAIRLFGN